MDLPTIPTTDAAASGKASETLQKPLWVKFFLFGLPGRGSAVACYWVCLAIGFIVGALSLGAGQVGWGVALVLYGISSAVGYAETIKWMDRHEAWGR